MDDEPENTDTVEDMSLEEVFGPAAWDEVQPTAVDDLRDQVAVANDNEWWTKTYGTTPPWLPSATGTTK